LSAGERVFGDKGYAAATVDDVIRASGTSRASYYRYFSGKDALFEELSRACFREMRDVVRGFAQLGPLPVEPQATAGLLNRYQELHARYGGVIRAWTERTEAADSPLHESGAAAARAMAREMERALAGVVPGVPVAERAMRATLLFLLVERSCYYVSNRVSRVDRDRLTPTLACLVERAYLGGS
jgi:AcrR family transcriptional regulator